MARTKRISYIYRAFFFSYEALVRLDSIGPVRCFELGQTGLVAESVLQWGDQEGWGPSNEQSMAGPVRSTSNKKQPGTHLLPGLDHVGPLSAKLA